MMLTWLALFLGAGVLAQTQTQRGEDVAAPPSPPPKRTRGEDVARMVADTKAQVASLFERAQKRIDARKTAAVMHTAAARAQVEEDTQRARKLFEFNLDAAMQVEYRNISSKLQELQQRETSLAGTLAADMQKDSGIDKISSSGARATVASRMQKTLDAHAVPLALQREIVGMTAANIPRDSIIEHLRYSDLADGAMIADANDIIIASTRASGVDPPKVSEDSKKAKSEEIARNLAKFKKAKEQFATAKQKK
jgi:hypothetical protein